MNHAPKSFHNGKIVLHAGDCMEVLKGISDNSIDAVCTDPPYHLTSIVKRFGAEDAAPCKVGKTGAYARASRGFMGKVWDGGDIAFRPELWAEVLRVLKPGGHMVAFSGTRTYHRMAVAIEDAGFEIRDAIMWHYGQGFPKSHSISGNLDGVRCRCESETEHGLHPLRQSHVPPSGQIGVGDREILFKGVSQQGASRSMLREQSREGGEGTEERSLEGWSDLPQKARKLRLSEVCSLPSSPSLDGASGRICNGASVSDGRMDRQTAHTSGMRTSQGSQATEQFAKQSGTLARQSEPQKRRAWDHCERCSKPIIPDGLGTALKPATEIICLARKPLSESTVAGNVLRWGTGALNIDKCRIESSDDLGRINNDSASWGTYGSGPNAAAKGLVSGRWPANLCHDGSPEVLAGFPETRPGHIPRSGGTKAIWGGGNKIDADIDENNGFGDSGSAARFFYTAKADADDRLGSKHPTVKPVDLMQWLVRLVCPKGGTVLDPFAGTGTTGAATFIEGRLCVLIEREAEYLADIERRMGMLLSGQDERARKLATPDPHDTLPLFAVMP